jgi:hypothetical protein
VWIFSNLARVGEDGKNIARVYEMQRFAADTPMQWVPKRAHPPDALTMRFLGRSRRREPGQR